MAIRINSPALHGHQKHEAEHGTTEFYRATGF